jgi:aspartate racemase
MRRIGLLGGTSWESTVDYYRLLNERVRERLGGQHSADLLVRSVDFAEVEALQRVDDWLTLGRRYAAEAAALAAGGAEVLGICANTMHLVHDDVARAGLPVVHLVDAVAEVAASTGVTRVGLLGTAYTMSSQDLYPPRMAARGIEVLVPEEADAAEVHRIIYAELTRGQVLEPSAARMREVIARLVDRGAQAVVLGCTELGMIVTPDMSAVPLLDSLSIHVDALLDAAMGESSDPTDPSPAAREPQKEGAA